MKFMDEQIDRIDNFQRKHKSAAFGYAVIKKYGEDRSAYNGALITYYGFLSLFPLLIVLTSVLQILVGNGAHANLINTVNNYFPVLGKDLSGNIHTLHKSSAIGLVIGLLTLVYGARGIADIIRFSINQVWEVPLDRRLGFPKNLLNSLSIIGVGGMGLVLSVGITGYAAGLGRSLWVRILTSILSLIIAVVVLYMVFRLALTDKNVRHKILWISAVITGVSAQILESFGGFLITHQLKNASSIYGTFAIVLGLLFWIYLLAQIMLYALQIGVVSEKGLWPRALNSKNPTPADQLQSAAEKV